MKGYTNQSRNTDFRTLPLNVALHWTPQLVPSHVACPLDGTAHGEHDAPHEFTLEFGAQAPPQSCVVAGHWLVQAFCMGMHAPAHSSDR